MNATRIRRIGVAAAASLLLLGGACGGSTDETPQADAPAAGNRSAAVIPVAGAQPSGPAPEFATQTPAVPSGGVTLEELHRQGKTEVIR